MLLSAENLYSIHPLLGFRWVLGDYVKEDRQRPFPLGSDYNVDDAIDCAALLNLKTESQGWLAENLDRMIVPATSVEKP